MIRRTWDSPNLCTGLRTQPIFSVEVVGLSWDGKDQAHVLLQIAGHSRGCKILFELPMESTAAIDVVETDPQATYLKRVSQSLRKQLSNPVVKVTSNPTYQGGPSVDDDVAHVRLNGLQSFRLAEARSGCDTTGSERCRADASRPCACFSHAGHAAHQHAFLSTSSRSPTCFISHNLHLSLRSWTATGTNDPIGHHPDAGVGVYLGPLASAAVSSIGPASRISIRRGGLPCP